MKHKAHHRGAPQRSAHAAGPSQRQLRAGELVRHALAEVLREADIQDPALQGVSVTVTEVRMSPDLKHAVCFVEPLGAGLAGAEQNKGGKGRAAEVVDGLNRAARFLRGRMGRLVELKFTPDLKFLHDETFDEAARMSRLFDSPVVRRDLEHHEDED
jgi:ribosome-binding factor A